jgi:hypothetical protein
MANTYQLISSNVLTSTTASVTFSSIPNTYTDLVLRTSIRHSSGFINTMAVKINAGVSISYVVLQGYNSSVSSFAGSTSSSDNGLISDGNSNTANTFSNGEVYIPNYNSTSYKQFLATSAGEQNGSNGWAINVVGNAIISTSPVTSIQIIDAVNSFSMLTGSSFYLYGISNA